MTKITDTKQPGHFGTLVVGLVGVAVCVAVGTLWVVDGWQADLDHREANGVSVPSALAVLIGGALVWFAARRAGGQNIQAIAYVVAACALAVGALALVLAIAG